MSSSSTTIADTDANNAISTAEVWCHTVRDQSELSALVEALSDPTLVSTYRNSKRFGFSGVEIDVATAAVLSRGLQSLRLLAFEMVVFSPGVGAFISSFKSSTTLEQLSYHFEPDVQVYTQATFEPLLSMLSSNTSLKLLYLTCTEASEVCEFSLMAAVADAVKFHPTLMLLIIHVSVLQNNHATANASLITQLIENNTVLTVIDISYQKNEGSLAWGNFANALMRNTSLTLFRFYEENETSCTSAILTQERNYTVQRKILQTNLTLTHCLTTRKRRFYDNTTQISRLLLRNKMIADSFVPADVSEGVLPFLLSKTSSDRVSELHFFLCSRLDIVVVSLSNRCQSPSTVPPSSNVVSTNTTLAAMNDTDVEAWSSNSWLYQWWQWWTKWWTGCG